MTAPYREERVYADTADGPNLEDVVIRPGAAPPKPLAVVWLHGLTGRFYAKSAILTGRDLAGAGTHGAATFPNRVRMGLDQFGLDDPDPAIGEVRCPILAFFGTVQDWPRQSRGYTYVPNRWRDEALAERSDSSEGRKGNTNGHSGCLIRPAWDGPCCIDTSTSAGWPARLPSTVTIDHPARTD